MKIQRTTPYLSNTAEMMQIPMRHVAYETGARTVKPEHMLVVMEGLNHGFGGAILRDKLREQGITRGKFKEILVGDRKHPSVSSPHKITLSKALEQIFAEAEKLAQEYIGTGELLHAFAKLFGNKGKYQALGLDPNVVEKELKDRKSRFGLWRNL